MFLFLHTLKNKKGFFINLIFSLLGLTSLLILILSILQKYNINFLGINENLNLIYEQINIFLSSYGLEINELITYSASVFMVLNIFAILVTKRLQGLDKNLSQKSEEKAIKNLRKIELKYLIKSNRKNHKKLNKKNYKLNRIAYKKENKVLDKNFWKNLKMSKKIYKQKLKVM